MDVRSKSYDRRLLGEVCTLQRGFDLPTGHRNPGEYSLVTSSGATDTHDEAKVTGPGVVTGRSGSIGNVFFIEKDFWPLNTTLYVKDFHGNDERYVFYLLQFFDLRKFASGAGVPTLNRNHVHSEPVQVACKLEEQKRIVAVLDQAFAALDRARAHAEANLADSEHMADIFLDDQVVSLIKKFGRIRIGVLAEVKGGKRLPKGQKPGVKKTPYPYITVRDMNEAGTISSEKVGFISEAAQSTIQRYTISSADIYISIAGTIGKTGVVPDGLNGANLTENAAKLVLSNGWLRDFVYWSTRSSDFRAQMTEQTRTAAQPKLALQRLGAITIPNADRQSQRRIVENMVRFHDQVGTLKSAYEAKLANIANLRQSLLQKAFSGQL